MCGLERRRLSGVHLLTGGAPVGICGVCAAWVAETCLDLARAVSRELSRWSRLSPEDPPPPELDHLEELW